jgi:hypothetical protein
MELPSILDWKIDSSDAARVFQDSLQKQTEQVKVLMAQLKPGDYTAWDLILFAYVQLIPGLLSANAHAQVRTTELLTEIARLNTRLERLTKSLIALTVVLVVLTVALVVITVVPIIFPGDR